MSYSTGHHLLILLLPGQDASIQTILILRQYIRIVNKLGKVSQKAGDLRIMGNKNFGTTTLVIYHLLWLLRFSPILKVYTSYALSTTYFYSTLAFYPHKEYSWMCSTSHHSAVKFHSSTVFTINTVHYYFHFCFIYPDLVRPFDLFIRIFDLFVLGKRIKFTLNFKQTA